MPQPIVSADDPALHDYVGLTDVALRRRVEPERGLYIAESEKVIRRALAAGHRPRSFLMAERWLTDLADVVGRAEADGIPVYVGDHEVIESLTGFHLHRGDTGLPIARADRGLDRRRTPPSRQERGVEIDAASLRQLEKRGRKNLAERHDDRDLRRQDAKTIEERRIPHFRDLLAGNPELPRRDHDRGLAQFPTPARRSRRLRNDERRTERRRRESAQVLAVALHLWPRAVSNRTTFSPSQVFARWHV